MFFHTDSLLNVIPLISGNAKSSRAQNLHVVGRRPECILITKTVAGLASLIPTSLSPLITDYELCVSNKEKTNAELWKGLNSALPRTILATFQKPGGHGSSANHVHIFA